MKPRFVVARSNTRPHWLDQVVIFPLACALFVGLPLSALFGDSDPWWFRRFPLNTWLLIGLGWLLLVIIERLGIIIAELKTLTFFCTNLLKDADSTDASINMRALSRMQQTVRQALGAPEDDEA